MHKMTEIELELISDIDMYLLVEKGMRGGISYIAKRFSKANNRYMQCYDDKKPSKYSIYGWTMGQYLHYSEFKWLNLKDINKFGLNSVEENSSIGCILEVDLEYPNELHELHNDFPLAPETLESHNVLSN